MSGILPNAKTQFLDANGKPLAGGSVGFYIPATLTLKTTWSDQGLTTPNANPLTLDSSGEVQIWGSGVYRQIVKDSLGNLVWDQVTQDPVAGIIGANTNANLVFSGPSSGPAATPTFRSLVDADLPSTFSSTKTMSAAAFNEAEANVVAAATTNIGAAAGNFVVVSGNTGITAFDNVQAGVRRTLVFTGTPTITASGNLIMPANYTVVPGDVLTFRSEGGGIWTLESYQLLSGGLILGASAAQTLAGTDTHLALTAAGFAGNKTIAANGYYKLPGGLIIQWGSVAVAGSSTSTVTFPIAFPSSALSILVTYDTNSPPANSCTAVALSASQMTVANGSGGGQTIFWLAIGN